MTYRHHLIAFADVLGFEIVQTLGKVYAKVPGRVGFFEVEDVELENLICEVLHAKHKEP